MNRHLHYQELEPGDHTRYHLAYAVANPEAGRIAHWGGAVPTMLFGFNVKSRALRSAILPIGENQRCDYWTFATAMDFDTSESVASLTQTYTTCVAYLAYRHLSGVMGDDLDKLPAKPQLEEGWQDQLK